MAPNSYHKPSLTIVIIATAIFGGALLLVGRELWLAHQQIQTSRNTVILLKRLAYKRPPHHTKAEWEFLVGWTITGYANCIESNSEIDLKTRSELITMLAMTSEDDVLEVDYFDKIWDLYAFSSEANRAYVHIYRPTSPALLKTAVVGCCGINVP